MNKFYDFVDDYVPPVIYWPVAFVAVVLQFIVAGTILLLVPFNKRPAWLK
jgi:hypothetical protein